MIGLINADTLNHWAGNINAPGELPRLIRLLIHALVPWNLLKRIDFLADEGIRLPGYDGYLELSSSVKGLPEGLSVWEFSAEQTIKQKANEDYEKRTQNPMGVDQKNTCFVFVTPRKWNHKKRWAEERSAEAKWKQVLAFDAENLAQWLEVAPGIALWFGQLTGRVPDGARSLIHVLDEYCFATNPKFDPAGTLIGRDNERAILDKMLEASPSVIEIEALTDQEGAAFVGECIKNMPLERQDNILAKAIWVEDEDSLRSLASLYKGQLFVLATAINVLPLEVWRHWIVRINTADKANRAKIVLHEQPMAELIDFVQRQGLDHNEACKRCYEANSSLERVRQGLMRVTSSPPIWSSSAVACSVAAVVLIGAWNDKNKYDQNIVAEIAGVPYVQFSREVSVWTQGVDPLLICIGSERKVHNRMSAWRRLEPYLTTQQLEALAKAIETVLLDPDPRFDLPAEDRWLANLYGKHRNFSVGLRRELAQTLVIMAVEGDKRQVCYSGERPQDFVNRSIHSIFQRQSENSFWRRIRGELADIAEASPDLFLEGLEKDLLTDSPQILELFENEGEHRGCLIHHLLWALESLAWSAIYVERVAHVLASLAASDPGGRYSNQPANSLMAIFEPGQPQCSSTAEERHKLIERLAEFQPAVTAELCDQILSNRNNGLIHLAHKPKWRQWAPAE